MVLVLCVGVGACGSSQHVKRPTGTTASARTSSGRGGGASTGTTAVTGSASGGARGAPNGEQSQPPTRILADAAAALRSAGGFAMQGTLTDNGQTIAIAVAAHSDRSLELVLANGPASARVLLTGAGAYMSGSAAFWRAQIGPQAESLAGHWYVIPAGRAERLAAQFGDFAPDRLARCLGEDHGTLSLAGRTSVDGVAAIVIKDAGDEPGSTPSLLAVAATGRPYPLKDTALGPTRPGGPIDVCNDGKGSNVRGTVTFGRFGEVPALQPPPGARSLGRFAAQA